MKVNASKETPWYFATNVSTTTLPEGGVSHVTPEKLLQAEHSPIRTQMYLVEMEAIPTFVSTHLVRHKFGVDHFVRSNRDGVRGRALVIDRNTPVNHDMWANAQALINISRERLCFKADKRTVGVMTRIRKAIREVDPRLTDFMVPECVYRNGLCPEIKECHVGLSDVMKMYPQWPGKRLPAVVNSRWSDVKTLFKRFMPW